MHEVCIQRHSYVGVKCQLAEIGASLCEGVFKKGVVRNAIRFQNDSMERD